MSRMKLCSCGKVIPDTETCKCKKQRVRNKATEDETDKLMRTQRWKKLRMRIIKRDKVVCLRCIIKYNYITQEDLTVHHIKPRKQYPELMFDESYLITVCQRCNGQLGTKGELDFAWEIPNNHEPVL